MSLKETLANDLKDAMRGRETIRKNTVQMVRAAILQVEKDQRVTLGDEEIIGVIAKELKKRKDVLPEYEKSGRDDLIDALKQEIAILTAYLPAQLSEEELLEIVRKAIAETGASSLKEMGKIMGIVLPQVKGKADGKAVNEAARKLLS